MFSRHMSINRVPLELLPTKEAPVRSTTVDCACDMVATRGFLGHCTTARAFLDVIACMIFAVIARPVLQFD
jgi:hypothetical protein